MNLKVGGSDKREGNDVILIKNKIWKGVVLSPPATVIYK